MPEPKTGKNRLHLDLGVDDLAAATQEVEALGASRSGDVITDAYGSFQVMRDPEGSVYPPPPARKLPGLPSPGEFCLCV